MNAPTGKAPTVNTGLNIEASNPQLATIEKNAGVLGRVSANWNTRGAASDALTEIRKTQINALKDVQKTGIALATATIKAAMVAEAMPALGTLTTRLNMATGSVDQALTNSAAVETYTHFTNRQQNLDMVASLLAAGKMTAEEAELINEQVRADSYTDINRTRARQEMAKETVAAIHSFGVAHIQNAKDGL